MEIIFLPSALADIEFWKKSGNKIIQKRISLLLHAILQNPFEGIGKPEPLKHQLQGKWSRRINDEHRIVYALENKTLVVYSLKGHYY